MNSTSNLFQTLSTTDDKLIQFQTLQHLLQLTQENPQHICTNILHMPSLFKQPHLIFDLTTILEMATTSEHGIEPITIAALHNQICQLYLSTVSNHGCILKTIRGFLKHRIEFTTSTIELYQTTMATLHSIKFHTLSIHAQIQLLKTIHILINIAIKHSIVGQHYGKDLYCAIRDQCMEVWEICNTGSAMNTSFTSSTSSTSSSSFQKQNDSDKDNEMKGFLTGNNTQRRSREITGVWLRLLCLHQHYVWNNEAANLSDPLIVNVQNEAIVVENVMRSMSKSDGHLLVLLSSAVSMAKQRNATISKQTTSTKVLLPAWTEWHPICLIGHLGTIMGSLENATECIFDTIISPEYGIQMLTVLLQIGKLNQSYGNKEKMVAAMITGREVLRLLHDKLFQLKQHLPFGVDPLLKVLR